MGAEKVYKEGKWEDGKASVKHLREDLRVLPSDRLATDSDDPDKIWETDDPHVVESIVYDTDKAERKASEGPDPKAALGLPGAGEATPVTQAMVWRAMASVCLHSVKHEFNRRWPAYIETGEWKREVKHMWFDTNNINDRALKKGKAPVDKERPEYLKKLALDIDVLDPPENVVRLLQDLGVKWLPFKNLCEWYLDKQRQANAEDAGLIV